MLTVALCLSSLLRLLTSTAVSYRPTDYLLLNCGSTSNTTSPDGRSWEGDAHSKYSPPASMASTDSSQNPSDVQVPYTTARIFQSNFTYTLPVSSGPKFVRLYFYPATYSTFDKSKSFFSITAGDYTLLRNFSAFLTVSTMVPPQAYLIKEFVVNVRDNQRLQITFVPSPQSYAFVNGVEVVSMPSNLYMPGDSYPASQVGSDQFWVIDNNTALETLYRLNVGGSDVPGGKDTGMYRTWHQDDSYIYGQAVGLASHREVPIRYTKAPAYTAPSIVYTTFRTMGRDPNINLQYNLTWVFTVYSGFGYLIRLHFCEVQLEVTQEDQRVFTVFLNNQTADKEVDVIHLSGGTGIPVFKDYVVLIPITDGFQKKQDLWLALHPNVDSNPPRADALLNGLEIFKLNQSDGNLAVPNPDPVVSTPEAPDRTKPTSKASSRSWIIIGSVMGGVFLMSILTFFIFRQRKMVRDSDASPSIPKSSWVPISYSSWSSNTNSSSLPSIICQNFSLSEIKSATSNFSNNNLIGRGGFGKVYKGYIDSRNTMVAIKRSNPSSRQGAHEFQTEIQMLSKARHLHLVSLIGYCDEEGEMILVYQYMGNGTLRDHLYNTSNPPLPWKQRLRICLGAAQGLHYLHTGAQHMIIHRDVKSTNILLDENWVARVSDFGLSKRGPDNMTDSHVSTAVKGSLGYVDPEYIRRRQLTDKSDVYSFGVVLLEVLCARPAVVRGLPKEQLSLAVWGRNCLRKGTVDHMIDPHLKGHVAPACLRKFGETINWCLQDSGIQRPSMSDVVWSLVFALQLQEDAEGNIYSVDEIGPADHVPVSASRPLISQGKRESTSTDSDDMALSRSKGSGTSTAESDRRSIKGSGCLSQSSIIPRGDEA